MNTLTSTIIAESGGGRYLLYRGLDQAYGAIDTETWQTLFHKAWIELSAEEAINLFERMVIPLVTAEAAEVKEREAELSKLPEYGLF